MIKFVVRYSKKTDLYLYINGANVIQWIANKDRANSYVSRYAAKKHLRTLDIHEGIMIEEL